ncbi:hypothetical protein F2Q68_00021302 [Brassica cretica]|uniref:Uncharacterized protein n=1 Tax=Brassica cretica TaxID=69181 RepID=A0A8S9FYP9_BRACR|nr:hypothetical protein F2Q68_00021302 [Brassica cretica]
MGGFGFSVGEDTSERHMTCHGTLEEAYAAFDAEQRLRVASPSCSRNWIRRDRHVEHVIWIVLSSWNCGELWRNRQGSWPREKPSRMVTNLKGRPGGYGTDVESCKVGCVLSDGSRCAYYGIWRVQSVGPCASHRKETVGLVCTDGSCVLMERDDCGTLGGYVREWFDGYDQDWRRTERDRLMRLGRLFP